MNAIKKIFSSKKTLIGMLHLGYLEGKNYPGIDKLTVDAINDIETLQDGGIDGILIENWKEVSLGEFVSDETAKNFDLVMSRLIRHLKIPFGINVLNNDYKLGFNLAKKYGASFVELDVFVDDVVSDFNYNKKAAKHAFTIHPNPQKIWSLAKSLDADNIPLFAFVQPKHYKMLNKEKTIEQSVQQAVKNNASAILITKATGYAPTVELFKRTKKVAKDIPVGIGSGFGYDNAKNYLPFIDFAVVGTSLKKDNITDNPVDLDKVRKLVYLVKNFE